MKVKSKMVIAMVSITLITVIFLGCLNKGAAEVKPEQIQVKEFKWIDMSNLAYYEVLVNSDYDGDIDTEIYIAGEKMSSGSFSGRLNKGENIIRGNYQYSYTPSTKRQEQLLIKAKSAYEQAPVIVYSKVIDMPYLSVEIIPSSALIHRQGDYLTLTNKGNIKGTFSVTSGEGTCGVSTTSNPSDWAPTIEPQESKRINLEIRDELWKGNNVVCKIEKGQKGSNSIKVTSRGFSEPEIILNEIQLNYINE